MNSIMTTIKKELRTTLRDKKSLLMMLIVPLFIPLFVFFFSYAFGVMLNETEESVYLVGINYELSEPEQKIIESLNLEIVYQEETALLKAYDSDEIDAYVIFKDAQYLIHYNENSQNSNLAGTYMLSYLEQYNQYLGNLKLSEKNINHEEIFNNITYEVKSLKGNSDMVNQIVIMAFVFAVMSITLSSIYSAIDATAGEKERGTLETILTFPVDNKSLIVGKYLASLIACLVTAVICIILLLVSLGIAQNMFAIYDNIVFNFNALTIALAFIILIGHALFVSGLSIAIASFSKTYKEAQGALTPISLVSMVPMFINMLGIPMSPLLASIPIINHTLLLNELFTGEINLLNIGLMFVTTIIYVILVIKYIISQYQSEKILFGA